MKYKKILTVTAMASLLISMSVFPVAAQSVGGVGGPGESEFKILDFKEKVVETGE